MGSLDTTNSLTTSNYFSRQNHLTNKTPNNPISLSNIKENYNNIWSITEIKNVEGKHPLSQFGRIGGKGNFPFCIWTTKNCIFALASISFNDQLVFDRHILLIYRIFNA